jgi:ankyrin repeat protein
VQLLVDHNADVSVSNNDGVTALMRATGKSKEILKTFFSEHHSLDHDSAANHPIDPTSTEEPDL